MSPVATSDSPAPTESAFKPAKTGLLHLDDVPASVDAPTLLRLALPAKRDHTSMLSSLSKARKLNSIRALMAAESTPGLISMLSGKPNPLAFPIVSFSLNVLGSDGSEDQVELKLQGMNLTEALQYGHTSGMPRLNEWLARLQAHKHGRVRTEGWRLTIGAGSQDLLYKVFLALLDPTDTCFVDSLVYADVFPLLAPVKCSVIEVPVDGDGVDPVFIAKVLEKWPEGEPLPKALYTVPSGSNLAGRTTPNERKARVLELARKYDFLILEDDPDFYLHYGPSLQPSSYFQMEKEDGQGPGHVIRFDTLSRTVAPGLRVGWCSGPTTILNAVDLHTSAANLHPSSTSQAISYAYLNHMGIPGFDKHVAAVSALYAARARAFDKFLQTHMEGIATWTSPEAGIYFWFDLATPTSQHKDQVSASSVLERAFGDDTLALPRAAFLTTGPKSSLIRVALGLLTEEQAEAALQRLANFDRGPQAVEETVPTVSPIMSTD